MSDGFKPTLAFVFISIKQDRKAVCEILDNKGIEVFHNRLSHTIPSAWNTTVKRRFVFNGDTLELHVDADKRRLKWIKQK